MNFGTKQCATPPKIAASLIVDCFVSNQRLTNIFNILIMLALATTTPTTSATITATTTNNISLTHCTLNANRLLAAAVVACQGMTLLTG